MPILNFEFKAHAKNLAVLEENLLALNPVFIGQDEQTDTYFNINEGRLKLREGNIENALIHYNRQNIAGAKQSDILLYRHKPDADFKAMLIKIHGVKTVVNKTRKIYFIGNVKFHFDVVAGLGDFVEVEAIDTDGTITIQKLQEQCNYYADYLGLTQSDLITHSYSDMLLEKVTA